MNQTLRVASLLFILTMPNFASAIDVNTQFCATDNYSRFWVFHVQNTSSGHAAFFGHVHNMRWPKSFPCFTQWFTGSGTLYPEGHEKENTAEFTIHVPDGRMCPVFTITLAGSTLGTSKIYSGVISFGRSSYPISLTFNFDEHGQPICTGHP